MSIWCSWEDVGHGDHFDSGPSPRGGDVRSYASGWSNHYPTADGTVEQPASVGLAHIAPWCVPGREDADEDAGTVGPWVRLDVVTYDHERGIPTGGPWAHSVVMDEAAARTLAADLLRWADMPKITPEETQ